MKKHTSLRSILFTTALSLLILTPSVIPVFAAYTININLGDASTFAILGGSTVTNTGPTVFAGTAGNDVGVYPGTALTENTLISMGGGNKYLGESVSLAAQTALTAAYVDAATRTPFATVATELGNTTLVSGVYNSADGTFGITGPLTLDAENDPTAVFIFQMASTLTTASASSVILINGADACHVFWQVGSSATLGTNSLLVGHVLAQASITATTGAVINGSLLARTGAVTLDSNTITNNVCATPVTPPVETPVLLPITTPSPLPRTNSPLDLVFLLGCAFLIVGAGGWYFKKRSG